MGVVSSGINPSHPLTVTYRFISPAGESLTLYQAKAAVTKKSSSALSSASSSRKPDASKRGEANRSFASQQSPPPPSTSSSSSSASNNNHKRLRFVTIPFSPNFSSDRPSQYANNAAPSGFHTKSGASNKKAKPSFSLDDDEEEEVFQPLDDSSSSLSSSFSLAAQCDLCQKWRNLPDEDILPLPDNWTCSDGVSIKKGGSSGLIRGHWSCEDAEDKALTLPPLPLPHPLSPVSASSSSNSSASSSPSALTQYDPQYKWSRQDVIDTLQAHNADLAFLGDSDDAFFPILSTASASSSSSSSSNWACAQQRQYKWSRHDVIDALQAHNADLVFLGDSDDSSACDAFANKLANPNATWTTLQENVLDRARLQENLSAVVAKMYGVMKQGLA